MSEHHRDNSARKGIWQGIGIAGLAHVVVVLGVKFFTNFGLFPLLIIGIFQLLYLVPLSLLVLVNKRTGQAMSVGIWIAAGITFLLNAACFGLVLSGAFRLDL